MAIDPQQIELTLEQKQSLAAKAEQTGKPWPQVLAEALSHYAPQAPQPDTEYADESFYDSMRDLIGIVKDAPPDLSTNPKYMQGFGREYDEGAH